MIAQFANLNWMGVALAFTGYFVLGGLWFAVIFKRQYAASLGKTGVMPEKPAPLLIVGPAVCVLVITLATALLIQALGIDSYGGAIEFGLVAGVGFLVANTVNIAINPNIPRPLYYAAISGLYHLVGMLMVSLVLVAMK